MFKNIKMFKIHELEFKKEGKAEAIFEKYSKFNKTNKHSVTRPVKTLSWVNHKTTIPKYILIKLLKTSEKKIVKTEEKKTYFVLSSKDYQSSYQKLSKSEINGMTF